MTFLKPLLNFTRFASFVTVAFVGALLSHTTLASGPMQVEDAVAIDNDEPGAGNEVEGLEEANDGMLADNALENGLSQRMLMNQYNYSLDAPYLGLRARVWLQMKQALLEGNRRDRHTTRLRLIHQEGQQNRFEMGYHNPPAADALAYATVWQVYINDDGRVKGHKEMYGEPMAIDAHRFPNVIETSRTLDVTLLEE